MVIGYDDGDGGTGKCELLGPFALVVQGLLGVLALGSLVWKRYHEHPHRRPWIIWFFDVSKQVFGTLLLHVLNLFLSMIRLKIGLVTTTKKNICDNPCDYYFLNILFDTTIGIPVLYFFIWSISGTCLLLGLTGIESGEYGSPPRVANYVKQLAIYMMSLSMMKSSIYALMVSFPILVRLAVWLLSRLDKYPDLQVGFVLLVFPLVMNVFQYYVVDNLIQSRKYYATNKLVHQLQLEDDDDDDDVVDEELPEDYTIA